jgi:hypothetical protein
MSSSIRVIESTLYSVIESTSITLSPSSMPYKSGINSLKHQAGYLLGIRYQDNSVQIIIDLAAKVVETLRSLPTGQKETFASSFYNLTLKL